MDCRPGCGACCIAPSITSPIPGMSGGKPAGMRCSQLDEQNFCKVFGQADRPLVCQRFTASSETCGNHREEALGILSKLEVLTR